MLKKKIAFIAIFIRGDVGSKFHVKGHIKITSITKDTPKPSKIFSNNMKSRLSIQSCIADSHSKFK